MVEVLKEYEDKGKYTLVKVELDGVFTYAEPDEAYPISHGIKHWLWTLQKSQAKKAYYLKYGKSKDTSDLKDM